MVIRVELSKQGLQILEVKLGAEYLVIQGSVIAACPVSQFTASVDRKAILPLSPPKSIWLFLTLVLVASSLDYLHSFSDTVAQPAHETVGRVGTAFAYRLLGTDRLLGRLPRPPQILMPHQRSVAYARRREWCDFFFSVSFGYPSNLWPGWNRLPVMRKYKGLS